jgi:serine/threonine protein kinase
VNSWLIVVVDHVVISPSPVSSSPRSFRHFPHPTIGQLITHLLFHLLVSSPATSCCVISCGRNELDILRRVKHRNIVELMEVIDDPSEDTVFIVFELLGSPVMDMSGDSGPVIPLPEATARVYFEQLVRATEYLHASGVIHRDIKPSNLLLRSEGWVKLVDFGVSTMFRGADARLSKTAGTPAFLAPETVDPDSRYFYGRPVDVWACGVTLYCLVFGTLPFQHASVRELYTLIRDEPVVIPSTASAALRFILSRILDKDPATRVTLPELAANEWVTGLAADDVALSPLRSPRSCAVRVAAPVVAGISVFDTPLCDANGVFAPTTPARGRSVLGERSSNNNNSNRDNSTSPTETVLGPNGAVKLAAPRLGGIKGCGPLVGQAIPQAHRSMTAVLHPWKHPSVRTPRPGAAFVQLRRRLRKNETNGQAILESFV